MWSMQIIGFFNEIAKPLAKFNPTIKDPISPGLDVTAIKSISDILVFAFLVRLYKQT